MRINNITPESFGYNKKLNRDLKRRLNENPNLPTNKTIYRVNELCNQTERMINYLEGDDFESIDKNEDMINILVDCFIQTKIWLAQIVNKMFPDLNYIKTECDSYHLEHGKFWGEWESVYCDDDPNDEGASEINSKSYWESEYCEKPAYAWRDMLSEQLAIATEINDEQMADKIGVTSTHISYNNVPIKSESEKHDADMDRVNSLIEKYTPTMSSPKSLYDVIGLDNYKDEINDLIILPLKKPKQAKKREEEYGIKIPHFVILYGPPGCGKTMLAQAIQAQSGCDMYKLDLSRIGSSYINESSKNITEVFDFLNEKAQNSEKPILLFMDEMDALLASRAVVTTGGDQENNKVVDTLLQHIQNSKDNNIIIIGATNIYDSVDSAVKNRANKQYYVGLPNDDDRQKLLKNELSKFKMGKKLAKNPEEIQRAAIALRPYSPRTIVNNVMEAASLAAYKEKREVNADDIIKVVDTSKLDKIKESDYKPKNSMGSIGFNNI